MITNKLKINDSKTEFIVLRSPQLRRDFKWFVSECWKKSDYAIIKGVRLRGHIQPSSQL